MSRLRNLRKTCVIQFAPLEGQRYTIDTISLTLHLNFLDTVTSNEPEVHFIRKYFSLRPC